MKTNPLYEGFVETMSGGESVTYTLLISLKCRNSSEMKVMETMLLKESRLSGNLIMTRGGTNSLFPEPK